MKSLALSFRLLIFFLVSVLLFQRCEKGLFPREYKDIYGEWTIRNVSGGFAGISYTPDVYILQISQWMNYYIYRNDSLLSWGSIEILEEKEDYLVADFKVAGKNYLLDGSHSIRLRNDTLVISDYYMSDGFSSLFVRSSVFENPKYFQFSRTLDFVEVNSYPIESESRCNAVFFQSESLGFITCDDGSILKSTDGGQTWRKVEDKHSVPLYDISFIDSQTGFAVGGKSYCGGSGCKVPGYLMLKTTDAGETWDTVALPYSWADLRKIEFYSGSFGITIGTGARLLTRDGGQTWSSFSPEGHNVCWNSQIISENIAYLSGNASQLYKTINAGVTWQNLSYSYPYPMNSFMFIDEQTGYAGFRDFMMKTTNGGISWQKMVYSPAYASGIFFTSETDGVVFGNRTYASDKWNVWDAGFNVMINGKWYGDNRISSYREPFSLNPDTYYTITRDNKLQVIKLTN